MGRYSDITVIISNALQLPRHIVKERRETEWQRGREGKKEADSKDRQAEKQKSGVRVQTDREADREVDRQAD